MIHREPPASANFSRLACSRADWVCLLAATVILACLLPTLDAQVPQLLNYQGRVQVGTNDFNGSGQFKFALVNADGSTTYWSNDGTPSGQPAAAVTLPVAKGLYSVPLGHTALPNMTALPSTAFTNADVHLRVWFNDGVNGFQQFVPDQRVVNPAYATTAGSLTGPIGVAQLPPTVVRTDLPGTLTQPLTINVPAAEALSLQGTNPTGTSLSLGNTAAPGASVWKLIATGPSSPEGNGKLLVRDDDQASVRLVLTPNGALGVGADNTNPLATAHVRAQSVGLVSSALQNDTLVLEGTTATLGLYSTNQGAVGSGLALKEVNAAGLTRDSWALVRNSSTAGSDLRLTYGTSANHATNPPVLTVQTNGATTIAGNVVVLGTITTAGVEPSSGLGASGLPAGTTVEVLINNQVAPGVRFEGLTLNATLQGELSLSRVTTDLSWPGIFDGGPGTGFLFTNPPVSVRLSLPNGGVVSWNLRGGNTIPLGPSYTYDFHRVVGNDGKPFDFVKLKPAGSPSPVTRTNFSLAAAGALPQVRLPGRPSGQPQPSSMRLVVNNLNYNNVLFFGTIEPHFESPVQFYANPTHHPDLSQWLFGEPEVRSVQIILASGLPGTVAVAASYDLGDYGAYIFSYRVLLASDGLPVEEFTLLQRH